MEVQRGLDSEETSILPSAKETTQEERYIQSEGARSRWLQPRETKMNILFWNIRGLSADGKRRQLSEL
jgi:hypothetical protein